MDFFDYDFYHNEASKVDKKLLCRKNHCIKRFVNKKNLSLLSVLLQVTPTILIPKKFRIFVKKENYVSCLFL